MSTAQSARRRPEPGIALSIIIVTFEARDVVVDCLESIYRNRRVSHMRSSSSITGRPTNERISWVHAFQKFVWFRIPINGPYAVANIGLWHSRAATTYVAQHDTILLPQAFDRMLEFLREHPEAGAVGSRLLMRTGPPGVGKVAAHCSFGALWRPIHNHLSISAESLIRANSCCTSIATMMTRS